MSDLQYALWHWIIFLLIMSIISGFLMKSSFDYRAEMGFVELTCSEFHPVGLIYNSSDMVSDSWVCFYDNGLDYREEGYVKKGFYLICDEYKNCHLGREVV